ncbi:hypothetical protein BT69DRAFT_1311022 [Atractiella rhizophila]|nr:hypothetical protein BT69DRAFT_1311022 [Atractiella rhizophila]
MDGLPTVNPAMGSSGEVRGTRSQYYISRSEVFKGVANRFVFSLAYIYLYLTMAALSLTTLVLSLMNECPTASFYVLETVVNLSLILEVAIRWVAFGKQFWKSPYNIFDLLITLFCILTLMFIFFSGCSAKGEEMFDTFLLIGRNGIQFFRLASVMRRSGKSIFKRPAAIDLNAARDYRFSLDLDLEDEEALANERRAMGGDRSARRGGGKVRIEEEEPILDSEEEEDS